MAVTTGDLGGGVPKPLGKAVKRATPKIPGGPPATKAAFPKSAPKKGK